MRSYAGMRSYLSRLALRGAFLHFLFIVSKRFVPGGLSLRPVSCVVIKFGLAKDATLESCWAFLENILVHSRW